MASAADSDQFDHVLEQIRLGSAAERTQALDRLSQRADSVGDAEAWYAFALGLANASRSDEAIEILQQLVERVPDADSYRWSLAGVLRDAQRSSTAAYHLQYLVEHATSEDTRAAARRQLAALQAVQPGDADRQLMHYQLAALRERLAGEPRAIDYERLGRLLLARTPDEPVDASEKLAEATRVLEGGERKYPKDVKIKELLVLCYGLEDPSNRLPTVLKELEALAPDSRVLQVAGDSEGEDADAYAQRMVRRAQALAQQAQSGDSALAASAVADLRSLVATFPGNDTYRGLYAFALMVTGNGDEVRRQADILAPRAGSSHGAHFNLGQMYWYAGDAERGRHHLDLAYEFAATDQDRQDVRERLADLSSR